jgi:hypothetical protein
VALALGVVGVDFWTGSQGRDAAHANWDSMGGGLGHFDAVGLATGGLQRRTKELWARLGNRPAGALASIPGTG